MTERTLKIGELDKCELLGLFKSAYPEAERIRVEENRIDTAFRQIEMFANEKAGLEKRQFRQFFLGSLLPMFVFLFAMQAILSLPNSVLTMDFHDGNAPN